MANANMIKFYRGLVNNLPAVGTDGALYITTDEGAIYLGTGTGMKRLGDFIQVENVAALPEKAHESCLYYCVAENILAKWNGTEWKQINKQPTAEEMKTLLGLGTLAYKSEVAEADLNSDLAKKINDASAANHGHDNKDVIDGITAEKVTAWDAAEQNAKDYADDLAEGIKNGETINDFAGVEAEFDKVVYAEDGKSLVADTEITRLAGMSDGANKVEASETNGNIKIDGVETVVYTHPEKHAIADVDGLQDALNGLQAKGDYAAEEHTHTKSEITDFAHTHVAADITDLDSTIKGYDYATNTELGKVNAKFADYTKTSDLPTDLGDFTNEAGYAKTSDVNTELDKKADKSVVDAMYTNEQIDNAILVETNRAKEVEEDLQEQITANANAITVLTDGIDPDKIDGLTDLVNWANEHAPDVASIKEDIEANAKAIVDQATNDAATYETKTDAANKLTEAKEYTDTKVDALNITVDTNGVNVNDTLNVKGTREETFSNGTNLQVGSKITSFDITWLDSRLSSNSLVYINPPSSDFEDRIGFTLTFVDDTNTNQSYTLYSNHEMLAFVENHTGNTLWTVDYDLRKNTDPTLKVVGSYTITELTYRHDGIEVSYGDGYDQISILENIRISTFGDLIGGDIHADGNIYSNGKKVATEEYVDSIQSKITAIEDNIPVYVDADDNVILKGTNGYLEIIGEETRITEEVLAVGIPVSKVVTFGEILDGTGSGYIHFSDGSKFQVSGSSGKYLINSAGETVGYVDEWNETSSGNLTLELPEGTTITSYSESVDLHSEPVSILSYVRLYGKTITRERLATESELESLPIHRSEDDKVIIDGQAYSTYFVENKTLEKEEIKVDAELISINCNKKLSVGSNWLDKYISGENTSYIKVKSVSSTKNYDYELCLYDDTVYLKNTTGNILDEYDTEENKWKNNYSISEPLIIVEYNDEPISMEYRVFDGYGDSFYTGNYHIYDLVTLTGPMVLTERLANETDLKNINEKITQTQLNINSVKLKINDKLDANGWVTNSTNDGWMFHHDEESSSEINSTHIQLANGDQQVVHVRPDSVSVAGSGIGHGELKPNSVSVSDWSYGNTIEIDATNSRISYTYEDQKYNLTIPSKTGTIAVTADIDTALQSAKDYGYSKEEVYTQEEVNSAIEAAVEEATSWGEF